MHPAQILAVKQEVLRADTARLGPWAQRVLEAEDPVQAMAQPLTARPEGEPCRVDSGLGPLSKH